MIINGEALEHLEHVDGLVHVVESAGLARLPISHLNGMLMR